MRPMFAAFLALILISIIANQMLNSGGFSTQEVTSSASVRVD
ncbi:MAG: hypothetical protein VYE27_08900 [Pseudomonadota bacterium]|nr:hypothetical protein [Pseudomonadota bacterium]